MTKPGRVWSLIDMLDQGVGPVDYKSAYSMHCPTDYLR